MERVVGLGDIVPLLPSSSAKGPGAGLSPCESHKFPICTIFLQKAEPKLLKQFSIATWTLWNPSPPSSREMGWR